MGKHSSAKLKDLAIRAKRPGFFSDGNCLYLRRAEGGSARWVFRFTRDGATRDIGFGPIENDASDEAAHRTRDERISATTLEVRARAARYCAILRAGKDPRAAHDAERASALESESQKELQPPAMTFDMAAAAYIKAHSPGWKNDKHRQQWRNTLATYASPVIGAMGVDAIEPADVLKILTPLWHSKNETASRLRSRIENVMSWAIANKHRTTENPARWRDKLVYSLAKPAKVKKVKHHPALPFDRVAGFMAQLVEKDGIDAKAMRFTVLTAVRTSEAIGARWPEFDLGRSIWRIPAERMKGGKAHEVPLSKQAQAVLDEMAAIRVNDYVFPGMRPVRPLSNMALLMLLKRMGLKGEATTHGFRSAFKDWASETTSFPQMVVEMALAHLVGTSVERAYLRSQLTEKRRELMQAWADFCAPAADVIPTRPEEALC